MTSRRPVSVVTDVCLVAVDQSVVRFTASDARSSVLPQVPGSDPALPHRTPLQVLRVLWRLVVSTGEVAVVGSEKQLIVFHDYI